VRAGARTLAVLAKTCTHASITDERQATSGRVQSETAGCTIPREDREALRGSAGAARQHTTMTKPFTDLLVVLPGILGSELRRHGQLLWGHDGSVLSMLSTLRRRLDSIALPGGIGDGEPNDGVVATRLIPDLHIVPGLWTANLGYGRLLEFLRSRFHLVEASPADPDRCANFLPFPYDWRLSNRCTARRLASVIEPALKKWRAQGGPFADAKVVFVCHSMGGLVARWCVEQEGGAEWTRRVVTLGTPHRGALKSLANLVNGTRLAWFGTDLTAFARRLPSMHQLLPEYACIETADGELSSLREVDVPSLDRGMVRDAMAFHDVLNRSGQPATELVPYVGFDQPTWTTARIEGGRVEPILTIEGKEEFGDGTVPRLASTPFWMTPNDATIRGIAEHHTALPAHQGMLDDLEFAFTARSVPYKANAGPRLSVSVDEVVLAGDPVHVEARALAEPRLRLIAAVHDEQGHERDRATMQAGGGVMRAQFDDLPSGAYVVSVRTIDDERLAPTVRAAVLVMQP
jgi:pimeloyl-ACP methyl ester carboxylesterase